MTNKKPTEFGEIGGREWLTYSHNDKEGAFAFPPIQGTHKGCYQAIKADNEVVPAEGLDLAILTEGAFTKDTARWQKVKVDCFVDRYTRAPMRVLWIPNGNDLAGVLLERDLEGLGRTTEMSLPKSIWNWKKGDNGIYVSSDKNQIFVPAGSYKIGEHTKNSFAKDGFATAVLTAEGAEIFARTASDAKLTPSTWGFEAKHISEPEQRVVLLGECKYKLGLNGNGNCWHDECGGYAFGKSISYRAPAEGEKPLHLEERTTKMSPKMTNEFYSPRGIGMNWLPCYICEGENQGKAQPDMVAFVDDKAAGERVVAMYKEQGLLAKLDYRYYEPNRVQVNVGACNKHLPNLRKLFELTIAAGKTINPKVIRQSVQHKE